MMCSFVDYHRFQATSEVFWQKYDSLHDIKIDVSFSSFALLQYDSYLPPNDNNIIIICDHSDNRYHPVFF